MKIIERKNRRFIFHRAGTGSRVSIAFSPESLKIYGIENGTDADKTANIIRYDKCVVIAPREAMPSPAELKQIEEDIKGARDSLTAHCERLIEDLKSLITLISKQE